jgi:hypothetical protein
MVSTMLAGIVVGLTACHTQPQPSSFPAGCQDNLNAGLAFITCQPVDVEMMNGQPEVSFTVDATGNRPSYQWFFVNPAGSDTPLQGSGLDGNRKYVGVDTPKLTIINPTIADCGFYYCQIDTIDRFGLPVKTQTRRAALGHTVKNTSGYAIERAMTTASGNIFSVVQPLPMPGSSGQSCGCGSVLACSAVTFKNQNNGYQVAPGKHFFDIALTNTATGNGQAPLDPNNYQVVVIGIVGNTPLPAQCAPMVGGRRSFGAASNTLYLFGVYFNCGHAPTPSAAFPTVALRLNP